MAFMMRKVAFNGDYLQIIDCVFVIKEEDFSLVILYSWKMPLNIVHWAKKIILRIYKPTLPFVTVTL